MLPAFLTDTKVRQDFHDSEQLFSCPPSVLGFTIAFMSEPNVTVTVKLFAAYQEAYGLSELALELPQGTSVAAVADRLRGEHPELGQWRDVTRYGINLQFVEPNTILQDGDEVVLIPPVSGG